MLSSLSRDFQESGRAKNFRATHMNTINPFHIKKNKKVLYNKICLFTLKIYLNLSSKLQNENLKKNIK